MDATRELALVNAENRIIDNFIGAPDTSKRYEAGDLVLLPNFNGPAGSLKNLSTKYIGSYNILQKSASDIYYPKDLSDDIENKYAHASTFIQLPPMTDEDAINSSATDKQDISSSSYRMPTVTSTDIILSGSRLTGMNTTLRIFPYHPVNMREKSANTCLTIQHPQEVLRICSTDYWQRTTSQKNYGTCFRI